MLNESQLDRINHIRASAGRNPVTLEQAQILIDSMNETDRARALWVIGREIEANVPQTCAERIAAAVAAEREKWAKLAESATCVYEGPELRTEGFDLAKTFIASKIRSGQA